MRHAAQYVCGRECDVQFCDRHRCMLCDAERASGSRYCDSHKCSRSLCEHQRLGSSTVCAGHKCAAADCDADGGGRLGSGDRCPAHSCALVGCGEPRCRPSEFCSLHKCKWAGQSHCSASRANGADFCDAHRCATAGCVDPRAMPSEFCSVHKPAPQKSCHTEVVWVNVGFDYVRRMRQSSQSLPATPPATARSFAGFATAAAAQASDDDTRSAPAADASRVDKRRHAESIRVGHYELGRVLGRGAFSEVRLALDALDPQGPWWAVKVLSIAHMRRLGAEDLVCNEIAALTQFQHDHLIRLVEVFRSNDLVFMVLELLEGGELFDVISESGGLSEEEAQAYFAQLISGVQYMHSRGVAHRDLKPENALFDSDGVLHIADFGFACNDAEEVDEELGTPEYQAPEVGSRVYDAIRADMWSLGVILFVMLAGYLPFDGGTDQEISAARRRPVTIPPEFPAVPRQLVRDLLHTNPSKRPTAAEVAAHPWVVEGHRKAVCGAGGCDAGDQAAEQAMIKPVSVAELRSVPVQGEDRLLPGRRHDSARWTSGWLGSQLTALVTAGAGVPTTPSVSMPVDRFGVRKGGLGRRRR